MKLFQLSISAQSDTPTPPVYGCTDPDAINYNPDATVDDGSCIYDNTGYFTFPAIFPMTFEEP